MQGQCHGKRRWEPVPEVGNVGDDREVSVTPGAATPEAESENDVEESAIKTNSNGCIHVRTVRPPYG